MKLTMAIDPGTTSTGYVIINQDLEIRNKGIATNSDLLLLIPEIEIDEIAIEMFAAYGMPVGKTSFDTVIFTGMLYQLCLERSIPVKLITRKTVKMHMCNSMRAKDSNITQAVKDRYKPTGGGKDPYKGIKSAPGPLFGFKSHIFAALALGITAIEGGEEYILAWRLWNQI